MLSLAAEGIHKAGDALLLIREQGLPSLLANHMCYSDCNCQALKNNRVAFIEEMQKLHLLLGDSKMSHD